MLASLVVRVTRMDRLMIWWKRIVQWLWRRYLADYASRMRCVSKTFVRILTQQRRSGAQEVIRVCPQSRPRSTSA
jgi:hypothetical protein